MIERAKERGGSAEEEDADEEQRGLKKEKGG